MKEHTLRYWAGVGEIDDEEVIGQYGETQLIAIARCYVQHKLGDEIEIPDCFELIQPRAYKVAPQ